MPKKSLLDSIQSPSPCSKNWEEMEGDELVRFCGRCEKNVYNLSAMSRPEAQRFAARNHGKVCIRYVRAADGKVLTADARLYRIGGRASRLTAGVFGAALTLSVMANGQTTTPAKTEDRPAEVKTQNKTSAKTSQISFTLRDPNGEVVPGIEVKLIDRKTKEEFAARSNVDGTAQFYSLPRADYDIKISPGNGFKSFQNTIRLRQPIEPNIKINLEVGGGVVGVFVVVWSEVPLFRAIAQDDNETVKQLIDSGFDVNTKDEKGETALHVAVQYGNLEIVKFLLEKGAKVGIKDKAKQTPLAMLFDAIDRDEKTQLEILRLLISKGADVNVQDDDEKYTLLMGAAENDDLETVKMLLEAGANPNIKDEDGETAIDKTDSEEIKRLLISYGAKIIDN